MAETILILSPHLDDAVLSCGGFMAEAVEAGRRVVVYNMFCAPYKGLLSPFACELHVNWGNPADIYELRLEEDRQALDIIGAERLIGDVCDAIYRRDAQGNWLYTCMADLLGKRHAADEAVAAKYTARIRMDFARDYVHIYAPMGIGGHVDHLLTFDIGEALAKLGYRVSFYEELPYAMKNDWRKARAGELREMKSFVELFTLENLEKKVDGVQFYASQIASLFESEANMRDWLTWWALRMSEKENMGGERFWNHR